MVRNGNMCRFVGFAFIALASAAHRGIERELCQCQRLWIVCIIKIKTEQCFERNRTEWTVNLPFESGRHSEHSLRISIISNYPAHIRLFELVAPKYGELHQFHAELCFFLSLSSLNGFWIADSAFADSYLRLKIHFFSFGRVLFLWDFCHEAHEQIWFITFVAGIYTSSGKFSWNTHRADCVASIHQISLSLTWFTHFTFVLWINCCL